MERLNFNLADEPRVNLRRLVAGVIFLLVVSAALVTAAYALITSQRARQAGQKQELETMRKELAQLQEKARDTRDQVSELKKNWKRRVDFANGLIRRKQHFLSDTLDRLEARLPLGTFIQSLKIRNPRSGRVEMSVVAYSFNKLVELYRRFADDGLHTKSETNEGGVYRASIVVSLKNDKK